MALTWIKHIVLILVSLFFLIFGVQVLISAYQMKDPFTFIMTFFASNFIILISGTFIVVFLFRLKKRLNPGAKTDDGPDQQTS